MLHDNALNQTFLYAVFQSSNITENNVVAYRLNDIWTKKSQLGPVWTRSHPVESLGIDYFHSVLFLFGPNEVVSYDVRRPLEPIILPKTQNDYQGVTMFYENVVITNGRVAVRRGSKVYDLDLTGTALKRVLSTSQPAFNLDMRAVKAGSWSFGVIYEKKSGPYQFNFLLFDSSSYKRFDNQMTGFFYMGPPPPYPYISCFLNLFNSGDSTLQIESIIAEALNLNVSVTDDLNPNSDLYRAIANINSTKNDSIAMYYQYFDLGGPGLFARPDNPGFRRSAFTFKQFGNLLIGTWSARQLMDTSYYDQSYFMFFDISPFRAKSFIGGVSSNLEYRNGSLIYTNSRYGVLVRDLIGENVNEKALIKNIPSEYGRQKKSLDASDLTICPLPAKQISIDSLVQETEAFYSHITITVQLSSKPAGWTLKKCNEANICRELE